MLYTQARCLSCKDAYKGLYAYSYLFFQKV